MAKDNTFSGMAHNALTAETTIVGKIVSQKDIRIDGTLEGRLECQGKVVIGERDEQWLVPDVCWYLSKIVSLSHNFPKA